MLSQVLYLAAGIAGLPVFAASPDLPRARRASSATGSYLMSYPFAAFVAGSLARRTRSPLSPRSSPWPPASPWSLRAA
jgi:biotin transporter BioY